MKASIFICACFLFSVPNKALYAGECSPDAKYEDLVAIEGVNEVCYRGERVIMAVSTREIDKDISQHSKERAVLFAVKLATLNAKAQFAASLNGGDMLQTETVRDIIETRGGQNKTTYESEVRNVLQSRIPRGMKTYSVKTTETYVTIGVGVPIRYIFTDDFMRALRERATQQGNNGQLNGVDWMAK